MTLLHPEAARRRKSSNHRQGLLLLSALVANLGAVAWLLFGLAGLLPVLMTAALAVLLRPRVPTGWVLSILGAQPLPGWAAPQLHRILDVLAELAGLHHRPQLYYVASPTTNAFVVGRDEETALAVTDGLLRLLNLRQMAGVLAHEVSHLHHGDASVMRLSDLLARATQWMAWIGLVSIVLTLPLTISSGLFRPLLVSGLLMTLPMLANLLQLAVCRSREYDADLDAATLTRDPEGLAQALILLELHEGQLWERILLGRPAPPDPVLLRTHPPTSERVRRLRVLGPGEPPRALAANRSAAPIGYPPVAYPPRRRRLSIGW